MLERKFRLYLIAYIKKTSYTISKRLKITIILFFLIPFHKNLLGDYGNKYPTTQFAHLEY